MQNHHLQLLLLFVPWVTVIAQSMTNNYCSQETPLLGEPKLPAQKDSFSSHISRKNVLEKSREFTEEYIDVDKQKLARVFDYGTYVYDMKDKIWTLFHDTYCIKWQQGKTRPDSFHGVNTIGWWIGLSDVWKHKGDTNIRGVKVTRWTSCNSGYIPDQSNFTADYYFTRDDHIPVRLELKGVNGDGQIHIIYDYAGYYIGTPLSNVFLPPAGSVCNESDATILPNFPDSAMYSEEVIDPISKSVSVAGVAFDKQLQVLRRDEDGVVTYRDFKRALTFTLGGQSCKITPMLKTASSDWTPDSHNTMAMASLKHYLLASGKFTYNGPAVARGIPCDLYTQRGRNAEDVGASVIEIYVAKDGVIFNNDTARQSKTIIRVAEWSKKPSKLMKQYEIYDFKPGVPTDNDIFDVSSCYRFDQNVVDFRLIFQITGGYSFSVPMSTLKRRVKDAISQALGLDYLRIGGVQLSPGDGVLKARGKILPRTTYKSRYIHTADHKVAPMPKYYYVHENFTNTPDICSTYCAVPIYRPSEFTHRYRRCAEFDFNKMTKACTFYFTPGYYDALPLTISADTDNYRRDLFYYNYDGPTSLQAWSLLKETVDSGLLNFTDHRGDVVRAIRTNKRGLSPPKPRKQDLTDPLRAFRRSSSVMRYHSVETLSKSSLKECATWCINSLKYMCEAFIVNFAKAQCTLYDTRQTTYGALPRGSAAYIRDYTSDFMLFAGRTEESKSNAVYMNTMDTNACAKLCSKNKEFYCQSFEMCGRTCILGRKHYYESTKMKTTPSYNCVHYSRAFLQDYDKTDKKRALDGPNTAIFKNIGVQKCAHICSTSSDYDCNVFEFCAVDSTCRVVSSSVSPEELKHEASGTCDLYTRRGGINRFVNSVASANVGPHTAGSMAGIGLGMIILGLILIVLVTIIVIQLRSRSFSISDSISPFSFSKKRLDEE